MTEFVLEIGVVYKDANGRIYLATDVDKLLTFRRGKAVDVVPRAKPLVVRTISVESMLRRWKIPLEALDAAMEARRELPPQTRGKKQIRGRDARILLQVLQRELRLARISD